MASIDLNADLGEGMLFDAALLAVVTSANVACGGHAGDAATMRRTVRTAQEHGVTVGAHPGWPDRGHFGRKPWSMPLPELRATLTHQVDALQAAAKELGATVAYVKLHGALANQAAADPQLARHIARWLGERRLGWLVMAQSAMQRAAEQADVRFFTEAFADRTYTRAGLLTPRDVPGAVLHDPEDVAARALAMLERQALPVADGSWLTARIDSLCVHGDTPEALAMAQTLRTRLHDAGWQLQALPW
jgi:UPF0271 protein